MHTATGPITYGCTSEKAHPQRLIVRQLHPKLLGTL